MFKKFFLAITALMIALFTTNVGECAGARDASNKADKAILAYAEVYAYGSTNYAKKAGLAQEDITEVRQIIVNKFRDSFKEFCLSDESLNTLINVYLNKLKTSMNISAKLKVRDAEHPVVTITAKVLDEKSFENQANNDPNIQALAFAIMGLQNEGKTEADLRADPTVQKTAIDCITKFINGLNFGSATTIDITCTKTKGADGKTYWAPQEPDLLYQFITAD